MPADVAGFQNGMALKVDVNQTASWPGYVVFVLEIEEKPTMLASKQFKSEEFPMYQSGQFCTLPFRDMTSPLAFWYTGKPAHSPTVFIGADAPVYPWTHIQELDVHCGGDGGLGGDGGGAGGGKSASAKTVV